jgi:hypothetical protein
MSDLEWKSAMSTRRRFLLAGGAAGLSLAGLLRAEAAAGIGSSTKSIINIHLDGGPPQMDMIDPKPQAPVEVRGEFEPIATRVPGIQISEMLPLLADRADKVMFIRSLVGSAGAHDAFQCQSGYEAKELQGFGGRPAMGCVVNKLQGSAADPAPAFVDLMQGRPFVRNSARPGLLGPTYQPFRPDISKLFQRQLEAGMVGELARRGENHAVALALRDDLSTARLQDRTQLLTGLDRLRRQADTSGMMNAMDSFSQQAVGILTSGKFASALDLDKEDRRTLERYSLPERDSSQFETSDTTAATKKFLLARRMIEAGVRCVNISLGDFDTHSKNFPVMRHLLPIFDHGLATLIDDLHERNLWKDVAIVVWGEFGRTPTVSMKTGGRDHWPAVGMCLLMGGSIPGGVVIGATDRYAGQAVSHPVTHKDVFATLYRHLGLDARRITLTDPTGRPQYILNEGTPIEA